MIKGGYGIVVQEVMRNKELSPEAKAIYAYLSSIAGAGGICYPSIDTIQYEMGMSRARITKYMNQLIDFGVVEKTRERSKRGFGKNVYKVTHEIEVQEDVARIYQTLQNVTLDSGTLQKETLRGDTTNINNNNNNNINNNNKSINVCPEPQKTPDQSGILLPLNNGSLYDVPSSKIREWEVAFPAVDVKQELRKMIAWLNSNPERKKTSRGINRFINSWLSKEQDRGGRFWNGSSSKASPEPAKLPEFYEELYKNLGKTPPSPDDPFQ